MNHKMTGITKNHNTASGMIFTIVALVLFTAMSMTLSLENPANAKSLTNANNITGIHNTHCDGDVCQTLACINNLCRTNSSQGLNPNVPCYLPCLPAAPPSKTQ
jgi:hypothetical protein